MAKMPAFIGIGGLSKEDQGAVLLRGFPQNRDRFLMLMVLATQNTLEGCSSKYPTRNPPIETIARILPRVDPVFGIGDCLINTIGYHSSTQEPGQLLEELDKLRGLGGPYLGAIQLNMVWPVKEDLLTFKIWRPQIKLILQITEASIRQAGSIEAAVEKIEDEYYQPIDGVIFDQSCGQGRDVDLRETERFLALITKRCPDLGYGVAGGLTADNVWRLHPVASRFTDLSTLAVSGLRDEADNLDLEEAKRYLEESVGLFQDVALGQKIRT